MSVSNKHLCLRLLLAGLLLAAGCADMPIVAPPPGEDRPIGQASLVLGPYLTSADALQPQFRFVTNRRCVAGIQSLETSQKYINRQASFSLFHSLAVPELTNANVRRYRLWLDDNDGGAWGIRGLPRSGQAVSIGFAGGQAGAGRLQQVADALRGLGPDAVVFTSAPFGREGASRPEQWETDFFGPLGDKVALGPLWMTPGGALPAELFPEHARESGYWRRDVGAVRIIAIDARAFSFDSSLEAALARLDKNLDPAHIDRTWTVVVLSRAAFDGRVPDGRILAALGDRLEAGGADLVIGAGSYYMRTRPFAGANGGQTRYITLSDTDTAVPAADMQQREYAAATSSLPHYARLWADSGTLEWQVYALDGRVLDVLTLDANRPRLEEPLSRQAVTADAESTLSLQREVLRMARQAPRAVPDPNRQQLISLVFGNPSTKTFSGIFTWEVPPGSTWRMEPMTMPFALQPGQRAAARFMVSPGAGEPPTLRVTADDVGSAARRMALTRLMYYDVGPSPEPVRLDARLRDKAYWKTMPILSGFMRPDGSAPTYPTEARITADQEGLIIGMSMAARSPSTAEPVASSPDEHRDGAVTADESIEIYLDPGRDGRDYYRFAINTRNVVLDESSTAGLSYNPTWRHTVRFGRTAGDIETWDAEVRIPWQALELAGPPPAGTEWGLQLVRRDLSAKRGEKPDKNAHAEVSSWVQTGGDNSLPGLYGILRFGDLSAAPSATETRAAPAPGMLLRGGGNLPLPGRIAGGSGFLPPPSTAPMIPPPPTPDL